MNIALAAFFLNMRFSVQFTWWVEMVIDAPVISQSVADEMERVLTDAWFIDQPVAIGQKDWFPSILIQTRLQSDEQVSWITTMLNTILFETWLIDWEEGILELSIIGPSIGDYIRKSAQSALLWWVIAMAVYVLIAFASMRKLVSPLMLWVITIFTMLFDVAIPAGAYGLLMYFNPVAQIDTVFIIALLTVMWYSVNDTIVIFDRVRENIADKEKQIEEGTVDSAELFEKSIWQTMRRSIGTSLSTLVVVIAMFIFWTWVLKTFAFVLWMWVIAGTYSSLFLAAPLAYLARIKK